MESLNQQVGGDHYKQLAYQPFLLISKTRVNFTQGCIFKYVSRYKFKNGLEDLQKILHYAALGNDYDLMPDNTICGRYMNRSKRNFAVSEIDRYCVVNNMSAIQHNILLATYDKDYDTVTKLCNMLIDIEYSDAVK